MSQGAADDDAAETFLGTTTRKWTDKHCGATAAGREQSPSKESLNEATIVLKTHDGDGYILPYLAWDAMKLQIEEIYRLRRRDNLAEAIVHGNFSVLSESGDIILPSLWERIVKPSARVQISLPMEALDPDLSSHYPSYTRARDWSRSPSGRRSESRAATQKSRGPVEAEESIDSVKEESDGSEDLDMESTSSESETSESPNLTELAVQDVRPTMKPTDHDGNNLTFQVNTAFNATIGGTSVEASDPPMKHQHQQFIGNTESLNIAKAVSNQADGRTSLQLHVLRSPGTAFSQPDIKIRWVHLQSELLDFAGFRATCLGLAGLSERLQKLLGKLFDKIEKEKLRLSMGGMFIEPGTVLRADESQQPDPESVIFSCIPYFDLQTPVKKAPASGQANRFPPRTLMQSYYPYEPVQDRDAEQAYRRFSNEQRDALVHVPNIWMVNIASRIVVTYGHQPLSMELIRSIEVIELTGPTKVRGTKGSANNVRLTDWDNRVLLYNIEECRSYFQMEQRLRELRLCNSRSRYEKRLQLSWHTSNGRVKVTPGLWSGMLTQKDSVFIELSLPNDTQRDSADAETVQPPRPFAQLPLPFFHWPQTTNKSLSEMPGLTSDETKRSNDCLENVEKGLLSEVLSSHRSYGAVERTFTSTAYYHNLPQTTVKQVNSKIESLRALNKRPGTSKDHGLTLHQAVVIAQHDTIIENTSELCEHMHKTLALFVADVEKIITLRKLWAAMKNICDVSITFSSQEPIVLDMDEHPDAKQSRRTRNPQAWFIRPKISNTITSMPITKLRRTFERCRRCNVTEMYSTSQAASRHLQKHFKHLESTEFTILRTEQWIINYAQMRLETYNSKIIAILATACQTAQQLFVQARELSEGVRNPDGQMSELYTFPRSLLGSFRQLLVFYFGVERAMFYAEESFKAETDIINDAEHMRNLVHTTNDSNVIKTFGNGVQQALGSARQELCAMAKSTGPLDIYERLTLSPEFVCSWFMRRLIVKPLEKSMTVSDMYREYLSTIQFQVNHRPGKRLLRSINLFQEEVAALLEVNSQQSKLISDFTSILDDETYEQDYPSRRALFPYERMLLDTCEDSLSMTNQEYRYLLARCGPLSDSTKQSLEINEEDHGKAILVFTVVTVIFLPLSFVTSFLGMNTTDIRDMGSSSTIFWTIAIPLTAITMGSVMYVGYNGDALRDTITSLYRTATGKQDRRVGARGISIAQRKVAYKSATNSSSAVDFAGLADEAEFARPRPDNYYHGSWKHVPQPSRHQHTMELPTMQWEPYTSVANPLVPEPRTGLRRSIRPSAAGYNTTKINENTRPIYDNAAYNIYETYPEAQDYTEPAVTGERHTRRRNPSPLSSRRYSPPPTLGRPGALRFDHTGSQSRPVLRDQEQYSVPAAQYEWTKKSHRARQKTQSGRRRRRADTNRRDTGSDDSDADWYNEIRRKCG